ncbi:MAG TPA: aminotransferase class V-fold PLP-dependent enzyme, partial [Chlamydiales bacterium]|nr:aminotransferase class V-fold PLP-dependent enzyme [Chlamydiales bacterium]
MIQKIVKTNRIYLDNNATTALASEVLEATCNALKIFGNPSSIHSFGQDAKALLLQARDECACFFAVRPHEVLFTSSGTEALNMLLRGFFGAQCKGHIITSSSEHSAVYNTVQALQVLGCKATFLNPGLFGAIQPEQLLEAIQPDTRLITLMAANSETGVKTDIAKMAKIAKDKGIAFVVDGVGLLGKEQFLIPEGISAMAFSGHKIHAPKGVGIAIVRKNF